MPSLLDNEIIIENDGLKLPVNLRDDENLYVASQEPVHVGYRFIQSETQRCVAIYNFRGIEFLSKGPYRNV